MTDTTTDTTGQPETIIAHIEGAAAAAVASIEHAGAAVLGAIEHPVATVERAGVAIVADAQIAVTAVRVELEDLVAKVKTYFHTTSAGHLEDALVAIATRVQALESAVADIGAFIGK